MEPSATQEDGLEKNENVKSYRLNKLLRNNGWGASGWLDEKITNGDVLVNGNPLPQGVHKVNESDVVSLKLDFSITFDDLINSRREKENKEIEFHKAKALENRNELHLLGVDFKSIIYLLQESGFGSRGHINRMINSGIFSINGEILKDRLYPYKEGDVLSINLENCKSMGENFTVVCMSKCNANLYYEYMSKKHMEQSNNIKSDLCFSNTLKNFSSEDNNESLHEEVLDNAILKEKHGEQLEKYGLTGLIRKKLRFGR